MKKAVVIGANGQDGYFLVKHLLQKNYLVMGIGRQLCPRFWSDSPRYTYYQADLNHAKVLSGPLTSFNPGLVFHVAAVHTSAGGDYESQFDSVLNVNIGSVHTVLEHIRFNPGCRFIYASSAKVFGNPLPSLVDESSFKTNHCLYSISKNAAFDLIDYYRNKYGLFASVAFLFNHESELRPDDFFIPKMLSCLAASLKNPTHFAEINTLNFFCDWGSAEEFMDIVVDVIERAPSEDFVLATGNSTYARNLVKHLFDNYGLRYEKFLLEKFPFNDSPVMPYKVDNSKLKKLIQRSPRVDILDICKNILSIKYGL